MEKHAWTAQTEHTVLTEIDNKQVAKHVSIISVMLEYTSAKEHNRNNIKVMKHQNS